jgi:probable FeS assembly SUF system protein SufT
MAHRVSSHGCFYQHLDYRSLMQQTPSVRLTRDCAATQIPAGSSAVLAAGTPFEIVQELGGSYTIHALGALFRVAGQDADALGLAKSGVGTDPTGHTSSGPIDEQAVWNVLRTCYDPEIPVNVVDLGLVYDLRLEPLPSGQTRVGVKMTLTAPGCGMGATIAGDAQQKLLDLPGVAEANVEIVWDPPWHHSMISPEGRATLGLD